MPASTQGTRTSGGAALVTLVVVAAIVGIATTSFQKPPSQDDKQSDEEILAVSVVFMPTPRNIPVHVTVMMSGVVLDEMDVTESPYTRLVLAPKGAQVSVNAYQEGKGELHCFIHRGGEELSHNNRSDPGSIRCWHNRK